MAKERPPLEEMTLRQLRKIASDFNIYRYSRKRKQELLSAIQQVMRIADNQVNTGKTITQEEPKVEPAKFELTQEKTITDTVSFVEPEENTQSLPGGYGESRIVLMPRDSQWTYAYWDIPNEHKEELRRQGGQTLILRLYDVTHIDLNSQVPHSIQEYLCDELAREWYLPVPVSNRDYIVDIGYRTVDGRWLVLARSVPVHIPPLYPSQWVEDVFVTVNWEEDIRGKTVYQLVSPQERQAIASKAYSTEEGYQFTSTEANLSGPLQYFPDSPALDSVLSSYVLAPGVGNWALPTVSGQAVPSYAQTNVSGLGRLPLETITSGYSASGIGMSGIGMSGIGLSGVAQRPRKFWLVADAELIVYGATEPDATVTIGGRPIKLNEDGTFRFQMYFPDGLIDYPIMAVAVDGEQTRSIHLKFNRQTPERNTNTKEEATLEWL
jgi:hypothetical protein